jgi:DNA polymerase-1
VAVSFDPPGGTFRNELYPEYKSNRPPTPQLIIDALEPLTEIVQAMNIPVLMIPGFEADDLIGSMAKRSAEEGFNVYMVTPDKDFGQLIDKNIFQYKPLKGAENEVIDIPKLRERYGIDRPEQIIDLLTICGDASDNVPGVRGVGEKGASKLLQKYGTVDGVYEHLSELTPRQQEMFKAAEPNIELYKTLVTIKTDIPLETTAESMRFSADFSPELIELFNLYEFNSLKRLVAKMSGGAVGGMGMSGSKGATGGMEMSGSKEESGGMGMSKAGAKEVGMGAAKAKMAGQPTTGATQVKKVSEATQVIEIKKVADYAIVLDGETLYVADDKGVKRGRPEEFKGILEDEGKSKAGYAVKEQMNALAKRGIALRGKIYDCELMHYLINSESSHQLEALMQSYLGVDLEMPEQKLFIGSLFGDDGEAAFKEDGKAGVRNDGEVVAGNDSEVTARSNGETVDRNENEAAERDNAPSQKDRSEECRALRPLADKLYAQMAGDTRKLYDEMEEPLIKVLSEMELTGVKIDIASLQDFAESLRTQMYEKEKQVREIAGEPDLNVSSPKQIGEVIFEKLKLDPLAKKPKKGSWSTDEETLSVLSDRSPIIDAILDYRGLRKLLSTYIDPFASYIGTDGRVHTTFNQALTSTGRLSSSNPNLQNIPVRTEQGREIRRAFVPGNPDNSVMMSADYSQIELRIMAHLSGDEHLCKAFRDGVDVHAATASKIFGIPVEDVTSDQRRMAKTANFGIMYGISAFGLSQRLKTSRQEAKDLIDGYFANFPAVQAYINKTLQDARENSYTTTLFGRRRYITDINSQNGRLRSFAERNAVNAPIQGTAADIIKVAMVNVSRCLKEEKLKAKMVLQIHDELLLEVPSEEIERVEEILKREMEKVIKLNVPLTVECNYGKNWLDAH